MNQAAELIDISTRPRAASPGSIAANVPEQSTATLTILPLPSVRTPNVAEWMRARQRLGQIAMLQRGWNGANGVAPDLQTIVYAANALAGLQRLGSPAPAIHPSADGAIYAEWHDKGLDIELIFEGPYRLVALVEDSRGEVLPFEGEADDTTAIVDALEALVGR